MDGFQFRLRVVCSQKYLRLQKKLVHFAFFKGLKIEEGTGVFE